MSARPTLMSIISPVIFRPLCTIVRLSRLRIDLYWGRGRGRIRHAGLLPRLLRLRLRPWASIHTASLRAWPPGARTPRAPGTARPWAVERTSWPVGSRVTSHAAHQGRIPAQTPGGTVIIAPTWWSPTANVLQTGRKRNVLLTMHNTQGKKVSKNTYMGRK